MDNELKDSDLARAILRRNSLEIQCAIDNDSNQDDITSN